MQSLANDPVGTFNPPRGRTDPDLLLPANNGGNTEPKPIARSGSSGWVSTQRPSHPVFAGPSTADCQIAIEEKCDRSEFGYPTPRTIAT